MDNDNKQLNKPQQTQIISGSFDVSNIGILRNDSHLIYLYKKTEKLVSAVYMLSGFISDKEPIKWQMREVCGELLTHSLNLSDRLSFVSAILKFLSFLEVSFAGGIISEMNYKILKYEFESLIQSIESSEKWSVAKGLVFPETFFEVAQIKTNQAENKGQNNLSDRVSVTNSTTKFSKTNIKDKSNRQEIILSLLKKNKELGIKDFVSSFSNCSEKTIQRELSGLVSKGLIRKEGEKRWSRYSLK